MIVLISFGDQDDADAAHNNGHDDCVTDRCQDWSPLVSNSQECLAYLAISGLFVPIVLSARCDVCLSRESIVYGAN